MKAMAILLYGMGWGSVIAVRIRVMNSRRYQFQHEDIECIRQWLLENGVFPPDAEVGVEPLQKWCDRYLSSDQWRCLRNTLQLNRRSRHRNSQHRIKVVAQAKY
jgi:hypothetical protein